MSLETDKPLVSIVMPAHNAERFIREAIESILAQRYAHWELLIMDDASSDGTAAVIRAFQDPRIHYHRLERIGRPSGVRNKARQLCRGSLVLFFDADDILDPDTIDAYVQTLRQPEYTAVYGFVRQIDENGNPIPSAGYKLVPHGDGSYLPPRGYRHTWERVATCSFVGTPCLMVRREVLDAVGWFDSALPSAEDVDLYLKLFLHRLEGVTFIPHYVISYRRNLQSLTRKRDNMEKLLSGHLTVLDRFYNHVKAPDVIAQWRSAAYARRYSYVAGVCVGQGYRSMALDIVGRALQDPRIRWKDWLRYCPSNIARCLLPLKFDTLLKEWVVKLRDGALLHQALPQASRSVGSF